MARVTKAAFAGTASARPPAGPYSPAIRAGEFVFVSGQLPVDPTTGVMREGDIESQTAQVLDNLAGVLEAAGSSLEKLVKTTVYLLSRSEWEAMNRVYAKYVGAVPPARCAVVVPEMAPGARGEIDAIAHV